MYVYEYYKGLQMFDNCVTLAYVHTQEGYIIRVLKRPANDNSLLLSLEKTTLNGQQMRIYEQSTCLPLPDCTF